MAEEVENVVEETTEQVVENTVDESKFGSAGDDSVIKVDLSKPLTNETKETEADPTGVVGSDKDTGTSQEQEEVQPKGEVQETEVPVLEELTEKEVEAVEEKVEEEASQKPTSFEDEFEESLAEELGELGPEAIGGNQQRNRNRKSKGKGNRR